MKRLRPFLVFLGCAILAVVFFAWCFVYLRAQRVIFSEADLLNEELIVEPETPPPTSPPTSPVRVPVLLYHRVRNFSPKDTSRERLMTVTPANFERQMQSLADGGFTPITPDELIYALVTSTSRLPPKPVLLTFDDGYKDHYRAVLPVLQRLQFQATFFIVPEVSRFGGFMSEQMVKDSATSGVVTIGSHTLRHAYLTQLSPQDRVTEIAGSKTLIESWIGKPVTSLAYPYGYFSPDIKQEVQAAGYALAFRTGAGANHTSSTRFELRRIQINNDTDVVKTVERYVR